MRILIQDDILLLYIYIYIVIIDPLFKQTYIRLLMQNSMNNNLIIIYNELLMISNHS